MDPLPTHCGIPPFVIGLRNLTCKYSTDECLHGDNYKLCDDCKTGLAVNPWPNFLARWRIPKLSSDNMFETIDDSTITFWGADFWEPFVQAWFFFGVIEEFFGRADVDTRGRFITTKMDGTKILTTRELPAFVQEWRKACSSWSSPDRTAAYCQHISTFFRDVALKQGQYLGDATNRNGLLPVPQNLKTFSISLFDTLHDAFL
jgi:hypothetical protein